MRAMRARGFVLAAGLALLLPATGAIAAPQRSVAGAEQWSEFTLAGSHGYRINVIATPAKKGKNVFVTAAKREGEVEYATHGVVGRNGSIHAGLADIGLISARFDLGAVKRRPGPHNCKGGSEVVRFGHFRGVIELHGDLGYTSVRTHKAQGTVTTSPRQVCRGSGGGDGPAPTAELLAGAGNLRFSAYRAPLGRAGAELTYFAASALSSRHGVSIRSSVSVGGEAAQLSFSGSGAAPEAASAAPPPPFQGSAAFHLTSPTTATWEGSLSVALPGLGSVPLTGPGFWSAACSGHSCTHTAPGNVKLAPVGF
jgi:hypothetical protein